MFLEGYRTRKQEPASSPPPPVDPEVEEIGRLLDEIEAARSVTDPKLTEAIEKSKRDADKLKALKAIQDEHAMGQPREELIRNYGEDLVVESIGEKPNPILKRCDESGKVTHAPHDWMTPAQYRYLPRSGPHVVAREQHYVCPGRVGPPKTRKQKCHG